jgi:large subunit ribosomal protein L9
MAKNVELLLVESVENLGIVGDVVKVRLGYARNFLLPRELATVPSEDLIKNLTAKRVEAQKQVTLLRQQRAEIIEKLKGYELAVTRACNDQGILYGSVTQQEIATALNAAGFAVRARDVRLSGAIKRVDSYNVLVKFETELQTDITLNIKPDRVLAKDEKPDLDFDNEGNLVEKRPGRKGEGKGEGREAEGKQAEGKDAAAGKEGLAGKGEKPVGDGKSESKWGRKSDPTAAEGSVLDADEPKTQKAQRKPREDAKKVSDKPAGKK